MGELSYQLASWPTEDVVVAEILVDGEDLGHVARRADNYELTIYRQSSTNVTMDMDKLQTILTDIRRRLG